MKNGNIVFIDDFLFISNRYRIKITGKTVTNSFTNKPRKNKKNER